MNTIDVEKNSLKSEYKYDLVYSNDPVKTADDIAMEWLENLMTIAGNIAFHNTFILLTIFVCIGFILTMFLKRKK